MTTRDYAVKKQPNVSSTKISQHDQIPDNSSGLTDFYQMQQAVEKPNAMTLTPRVIINLQRTIGNQAVQRLLNKSASVSKLAPQPAVSIKNSIQLSRSGVVTYARNKFYVDDPDEGLIMVDRGNFTISVGTTIEYDIVKPNKFLTKAVVVSTGERPEATDIGSEIRERNATRTDAVKVGGYFDVDKVILIGRLNISGAKKHYNDIDAVATSDSEVIDLLDGSKVEVTDVQSKADTFKIDLGGINSIVGEIIYTNTNKDTVRSIKVFHVGPSQ